jgi:hypothetical protein
MSEQVKFPKERMLEALYAGPVEDKIIGHGRWTVHHLAVFEIDGRFYEARYSVGATENQEEMPWEYEKEITCIEVHKVTRMVEVTSWEPK